MTRLVIRGARLLGTESADLLVEDGVITEVGSVSAPADAEVLDADGLVALPGLVDLHVHLREPGREDAEFFVHDAGSRNGVALAVHGDRQLKPGQRVLVGDQILRVETV